MSDAKPARRRHNDAELKREFITACAALGASVTASTAAAHKALCGTVSRAASGGGAAKTSTLRPMPFAVTVQALHQVCG